MNWSYITSVDASIVNIGFNKITVRSDYGVEVLKNPNIMIPESLIKIGDFVDLHIVKNKKTSKIYRIVDPIRFGALTESEIEDAIR